MIGWFAGLQCNTTGDWLVRSATQVTPLVIGWFSATLHRGNTTVTTHGKKKSVAWQNCKKGQTWSDESLSHAYIII